MRTATEHLDNLKIAFLAWKIEDIATFYATL